MGLELPEIQNLYRQMNENMIRKSITKIILGKRCNSLIKQGMCNLDKRKDEILNIHIKSIKSNGKWIFIQFANEKYLLLGEIIGKFHYQPNYKEIPTNYHVLFELDDNTVLIFQSSLYAFLQVVEPEGLKNHKYAGNLGLNPIDKQFTYTYFSKILSSNKNKGIKGVLNLQNQISGLGNAYINDILNKAKIHPKSKVSSLNETKRKEIYNIIIKTMKLAIEEGGSLKEYDLFGNHGSYERIVDQQSKDKKCPECGLKMKKVNILGSSSYICPQCQVKI